MVSDSCMQRKIATRKVINIKLYKVLNPLRGTGILFFKTKRQLKAVGRGVL